MSLVHNLPPSFKQIEVKNGESTGLKQGQQVAFTDGRAEPQTTSELARNRWERVNFYGTFDSESETTVTIRRSTSTNNIAFSTSVSKIALEHGAYLLYAEQDE